MKKALYAGSFDPLTLGHLDIVHRIAPLFDEVHVLVANSHSKQYLFTSAERVELIKENVSVTKNVKVASTDGLLVDYARTHGVQTIIRGLRAISDFEYEVAMANMNRELGPEIETMIIFTRPEFSHLASRMVKEVASHGADLSKFVPKNVIQALKKKDI